MTEQVLTWQGPRAVPAPLRPTKAHSPGSFWELARELDPYLYRTALFLTRDEVEARELVQDTFECGLRDFSQYRPNSNFRAWLAGILHHRFLDRCRVRAREAGQRTAIEEVEESLAHEPYRKTDWEYVTTADLLREADNLRDGFREVFMLVGIERRSQKEAGAKLGIPPSTVGTRYMRAKAKLKELLLRSKSGRAS